MAQQCYEWAPWQLFPCRFASAYMRPTAWLDAFNASCKLSQPEAALAAWSRLSRTSSHLGSWQMPHSNHVLPPPHPHPCPRGPSPQACHAHEPGCTEAAGMLAALQLSHRLADKADVDVQASLCCGQQQQSSCGTHARVQGRLQGSQLQLRLSICHCCCCCLRSRSRAQAARPKAPVLRRGPAGAAASAEVQRPSAAQQRTAVTPAAAATGSRRHGWQPQLGTTKGLWPIKKDPFV